MNIGLIDVDGHNFPNVALMKLASWHRQQGDTAEWAMPLFGHYDRIYASKVFTFTKDYNPLEYDASEFVGGGYWLRHQEPTAGGNRSPSRIGLRPLSAISVLGAVLQPWLHPPLSVLPGSRQGGRYPPRRADGMEPTGGVD